MPPDPQTVERLLHNGAKADANWQVSERTTQFSEGEMLIYQALPALRLNSAVAPRTPEAIGAPRR